MDYITTNFINSVLFNMEERCKIIGKNNLAVGLGERFIAWLTFVPIWVIPFIK